MTAVAPAVGRTRPAAVPWRRLTWVAWRQHRAALAALVAVGGVIAVAMAVTGLVLHSYGTRMFSVGPNSPWRLYLATQTVLVPVLLLIPVLAGMFLGAPLVAREYEAGTTRFAWCQAAGRVRLVLAALAPATLLLAIVAAGLGLEHRWWLTSVAASNQAWEPGQFSLSPLPFVGWTVFGFSLGVSLGALIRRTVPAMAATLACYAVLFYNVAISWRGWRYYYLPPRRVGVQPTFSAGGNGMSYGFSFGGTRGPSSDILSTGLGWPDGRLLSPGQYGHPAAWFRLHHIQVWLTYQPGSRLSLFQFIEAGWLVALSALLIAAMVVVIRRRAA